MRIAYFINQYPAVSHSFIRREIRAMERLGLDIARFAIRPGANLVDAQDVAEAEKTRFLGRADFAPLAGAIASILLKRIAVLPAVFWQAIRMGWRSDRGLLRHLAYALEGMVLAHWCMRDGIEHIHAHFGTNSACIALFASRLSGIPYSFTAHGPEEFEKGRWLSLDDKLRFATFAVCVSSFGRAQLMRYTGADLWPKIVIVHCGLDETFLAVEPTQCPETQRFVCVGRLCPEKAQHILVAAVQKLRERGEACEIVLAGDGPSRPQIEAAIAHANLQGSIKITGWVSGARVKAEIETARALVLPSFAENLPLAIMEAMALGRPVISTFVAGIPELVEAGKTGWLAPAGDVASLAQAMQEALSAPIEKLTAMGSAGRARVLEKHDALREARKLKQLIEERRDQIPSRALDRACVQDGLF